LFDKFSDSYYQWKCKNSEKSKEKKKNKKENYLQQNDGIDSFLKKINLI
jgi:hypothetical protein